MRRPLLAVFLFLCPLSVLGAEALQEIVVREGDTLWAIANHYLKDPTRWPDLLKHNPQIGGDPTVALPGMRLKVPVLLIKEKLRAAELVYLLKDVRYRRRDNNLWKPAQKGLELYIEDGIRTLDESLARIRFPTGEVVNLSENSLVIVRPEKGQDAVELLSGDVRAGRSRVITAGGARVDPLGPDAEYRTRVKLDKSELVLVYKGRVEVTAQGKTVRVPEGFGTEIKPQMPPAEPVPLPEVPALRAPDAPPSGRSDPSVRVLPQEGELVLAVDVPAVKELPRAGPSVEADPKTGQARVLSRGNLMQKYHLQVDEDQKFEEPLADRYLLLSQKFDLRKMGLPDGTYWWRVAFVDSLGMEGAFSTPQPFRVDLSPPLLTVTTPAEGEELSWDNEFVQIAGETEPGVQVEVDNKPASVDSQGHFSITLYMREGKNRLVFEARDTNGNRTTLERVVYRLLPGQKGKFRPGVVRKQETAPNGKNEGSGFLATVAVGLLTIGTILGVILLIVQ